jgi:radical SAM superfamily enzyme YgiQ (UPF0313 family)
LIAHPSDNSFGTAVIRPRWLFVLAAATPETAGNPILVDESLEQLDPSTIQAGDVVGISVHTGNALRGYEVGRICKERGATVVYGGIRATLFPEEPFERGHADAVVKGDRDVAWGRGIHRSRQDQALDHSPAAGNLLVQEQALFRLPGVGSCGPYKLSTRISLRCGVAAADPVRNK